MKDLDFLVRCTNAELDFLVQIILDKGGLTGYLASSENYKKYHPNHQKYVKEIIDEILDFGSNTLWFRKSYKEVLEDVCKRLDVSYSSSDDVKTIEISLLTKILSDQWNKMSDNDKKAIIQDLDINANMISEKGMLFFVAIFKTGGSTALNLATAVINMLSKTFFNRILIGVSGTVALKKFLGSFLGPIGWLLTLCTIKDIAGPAYRVTVPAVIYIAALRQTIRNKNSYTDSVFLPKFNAGSVIYAVRHHLPKGPFSPIPAVYRHYGIYAGNNAVIHFAPDKFGRRIIHKAPMEEFLEDLKPDECHVQYFPETFESLKLMLQHRCENDSILTKMFEQVKSTDYKFFSDEQTLERAKKCIGDGGYKLLENNCEHFALWCKTNVAYSKQRDHFFNVLLS